MNALPFTFAGEPLLTRPAGALIQPDAALLCVSDLHLGKSDRIARGSGPLLPPYETRATLDRPSPFAAPLFFEPGRVPVAGEGRERLAEEAAARLLSEAGLDGL
jgi:hypothetical protein